MYLTRAPVFCWVLPCPPRCSAKREQTLPVLGWTSVGLLFQGPLVHKSHWDSTNQAPRPVVALHPLCAMVFLPGGCRWRSSRTVGKCWGGWGEKWLFLLYAGSVKGVPKQSLDKSPFLPRALSPLKIHTHFLVIETELQIVRVICPRLLPGKIVETGTTSRVKSFL